MMEEDEKFLVHSQANLMSSALTVYIRRLIMEYLEIIQTTLSKKKPINPSVLGLKYTYRIKTIFFPLLHFFSQQTNFLIRFCWQTAKQKLYKALPFCG